MTLPRSHPPRSLDDSMPFSPTPTASSLHSAKVLEELQARAIAAAANAYAPYSQFRVGAALLLAEPHAGEVVTGCNVENASFRLTTCAEQTAVTSAVARFGPAIRLAAVAVANLNHAASMPCGACRQTLLEFAPTPAAVIVLFPGTNDSGILTPQSSTLADLLPAAFRLSQQPVSHA